MECKGINVYAVREAIAEAKSLLALAKEHKCSDVVTAAIEKLSIILAKSEMNLPSTEREKDAAKQITEALTGLKKVGTITVNAKGYLELQLRSIEHPPVVIAITPKGLSGATPDVSMLSSADAADPFVKHFIGATQMKKEWITINARVDPRAAHMLIAYLRRIVWLYTRPRKPIVGPA